MPNRPKRPRDANQLAKMIVDISTGEVEELDTTSHKNKAAVELGRLGGLKGGKARAVKLSPERRSEIARDAVNARWSNSSKNHPK